MSSSNDELLLKNLQDRIKLRSEQAQKLFGNCGQHQDDDSIVDSLFYSTVDPMSIRMRMYNYCTSTSKRTVTDHHHQQSNTSNSFLSKKINKVIKSLEPQKEQTLLTKRKHEQVIGASNNSSIDNNTPSSSSSSSRALQLHDGNSSTLTNTIMNPTQRVEDSQTAVVAFDNPYYSMEGKDELTKSLILQEKRRRREIEQKPQWHPSWKLMKVIPGHNGWVRTISVDVSNEWFVTGSNDRTIKIFDLASGELKLTLSGHASTVRGLAVSARSPYLFSVGEDKSVKCWDLETNKCIRQYRGHLSGIYSCALHPSLDILATGGRDSSCRVWDIRTTREIFLLTGHNNTVTSILGQEHEPQIITGSSDATIRLWDLKKGTTRTTLTHHKKSVRSLTLHPTEYTFASASPDSVRKWKCPEGNFMLPYEGNEEDVIVHSMDVNNDGVMVCANDNGYLDFWDWKTAHHFCKIKNIPQAGSLDSESAVLSCKFDRSGSRLITGCADKTIKIYKEDETQVPPEDEEGTKFYISNLFGKKKY